MPSGGGGCVRRAPDALPPLADTAAARLHHHHRSLSNAPADALALSLAPCRGGAHGRVRPPHLQPHACMLIPHHSATSTTTTTAHLELIAQHLAVDLGGDALVVEVAQLRLVIDLKLLLAARRRVRDVELHLAGLACGRAEHA
jgi:hypothetical protein